VVDPKLKIIPHVPTIRKQDTKGVNALNFLVILQIGKADGKIEQTQVRFEAGITVAPSPAPAVKVVGKSGRLDRSLRSWDSSECGYLRRTGETQLVRSRTLKDSSSEGLEKYGGFTPAQVEAFLPCLRREKIRRR